MVSSNWEKEVAAILLDMMMEEYVKIVHIMLIHVHESSEVQQSQSLGESHPVPAQTLPAYKIAIGRATEVPSLEN